MIWIIIAAGMLGIGFTLLLPAAGSRGKDCFYGKTWFAHRGLHDDQVAENSMLAFERAVVSGYGIELDVRLTKDECLVVFHDNTLRRLCGREESVRQLTLEEIQTLQLPDGQKVPQMTEVIKLLNEKGKTPLLVEIKSHKMGDCRVSEKLYELLKHYQGPCAVQSFDPMQLRWFKKHAPHITRGQLAQKAEGDGLFRLKNLPQVLAGNLLFNRLSAPHYVAYRYEDTQKCCYRLMRKVFRPGLAVWTVRSQTEAHKIKNQCDAIIFEGFRPES